MYVCRISREREVAVGDQPKRLHDLQQRSAVLSRMYVIQDFFSGGEEIFGHAHFAKLHPLLAGVVCSF